MHYLQRLFAAEGLTVTEFALGRCLARAYMLPTDRRFADLPIGAIAFEAGFVNQPYFNRGFRNRYGARLGSTRRPVADR